MKFIVVIFCVLLCCSCISRKIKRQEAIKEWEETYRSATISDSIESQFSRVQKIHQGVSEVIEVKMDSIFYWHPDSGLRERSGIIGVKIYRAIKKDTSIIDSSFINHNHLKRVNEAQGHKVKRTYANVNKLVDKDFKLTTILVLILIGLVFLIIKIKR